MPCPLITTDIGTGGLGQGTVHALPLPPSGRPVDRSPGLRMTEPSLPAELGEPGRHRGLRGLRSDPEVPSRPPHQQRVPGRFSGGNQQQQLRRRWKQGELVTVTLLDPARRWHHAGQAEPAGQLPWRQPA